MSRLNRIINYMFEGKYVTDNMCSAKFSYGAIRSRVSEWRRNNIPILDEWVNFSSNGERVNHKKYFFDHEWLQTEEAQEIRKIMLKEAE